MILDIHSWFTEFEREYYSDYFSLIQEYIGKREEQLIREYDEAKRSLKEDENDEDLNEHFSDLWFSHQMFEQLLYRSLCVSSMIFIETRLNELCRIIHQAKNLKFRVEELKGEGLSRAKKYLSKTLAETKFFEDKSLNETLEVVRIIRNAIVHNDAVISDNHLAQMTSYIQSHQGSVTLEQPMNKVVLNKVFANELMACLENVSGEIQKAYSVIKGSA